MLSTKRKKKPQQQRPNTYLCLPHIIPPHNLDLIGLIYMKQKRPQKAPLDHLAEVRPHMLRVRPVSLTRIRTAGSHSEGISNGLYQMSLQVQQNYYFTATPKVAFCMIFLSISDSVTASVLKLLLDTISSLCAALTIFIFIFILMVYAGTYERERCSSIYVWKL